MPQYEIGQEVRLRYREARWPAGTIVRVINNEPNLFTVEGDTPVGYGHDGDGRGRRGYCLFTSESMVEPVMTPVPGLSAEDLSDLLFGGDKV